MGNMKNNACLPQAKTQKNQTPKTKKNCASGMRSAGYGLGIKHQTYRLTLPRWSGLRA
jgi:hypothetical protein